MSISDPPTPCVCVWGGGGGGLEISSFFYFALNEHCAVDSFCVVNIYLKNTTVLPPETLPNIHDIGINIFKKERGFESNIYFQIHKNFVVSKFGSKLMPLLVKKLNITMM